MGLGVFVWFVLMICDECVGGKMMSDFGLGMMFEVMIIVWDFLRFFVVEVE